jgi:hypothetical protein
LAIADRKFVPLFLLLFSVWGCNGDSLSGLLNTASGDCPDVKTEEITPDLVEEITIRPNSSYTKKLKLSANEIKAVSFAAEKGERFSWSSPNENLCVLIYTPQNDILDQEAGVFPVKGTYTVVATLAQGVGLNDLILSRGEVVNPVNATNPPAPSNSVPTPNPQMPEPITGEANPPSAALTSDRLSQDQAAQLVQNYLDAKPNIFGGRFDRDLAKQHTTGILYTDITKPNGSIDWLVNNGSHYEYKESRVDQVWEYNSSLPEPTLLVRIVENPTLYSRSGKIDRSRSGKTIANFLYTFAKDNGKWKIKDYKKQSS